MPSVPERELVHEGVPSRAAHPRGERPPVAVTAVALLYTALGAAAVLVLGVVTSVDARSWPLRTLDALVPGPPGPQDAAPGLPTAMALCAMLLTAGTLLTFTAPELLRGNRLARVTVWTATPLLVAAPVRWALLTLGADGTGATVAVCALGISALALLAALLLAHPAARGRHPEHAFSDDRAMRQPVD